MVFFFFVYLFKSIAGCEYNNVVVICYGGLMETPEQSGCSYKEIPLFNNMFDLVLSMDAFVSMDAIIQSGAETL